MQQKVILALVAALITLPSFSNAMPAVSCHCFQNREFDANQPAAADDYLLTTTFNTFQGLALGIDKKSIVRAKMSGRTSEELWLKHWLAKEIGVSVKEITERYEATGSWRELARRAGLAERGGFSLTEELSSDRKLAESVARWEMIRYFGIKKEELADLQKKGASLKEMTLSLFISALTSCSAEEVFDRVHAEGESWGRVAQRAGITFSAVETKMTRQGVVKSE